LSSSSLLSTPSASSWWPTVWHQARCLTYNYYFLLFLLNIHIFPLSKCGVPGKKKREM
jgi:hypothetical protein